ncbi:hypothetical protein D1872_327110 [compost metagenome]
MGPISKPDRPVRMTNTAVIVGLPPSVCDTLMAIGVVIERGMMLCSRDASRCIHCAIIRDDSTAIREPLRTLTIISSACFLST